MNLKLAKRQESSVPASQPNLTDLFVIIFNSMEKVLGAFFDFVVCMVCAGDASHTSQCSLVLCTTSNTCVFVSLVRALVVEVMSGRMNGKYI